MIIRVIDFETTGLTPAHKVVEWASCDLVETPEGWQRGREISSLINPGLPIPPEVSAVHHIINDDVKDAPLFLEQLKVITGPPFPDIWCAHNNRFDMQFFSPPNARWIDTYRCALWLWPQAPGHGNQVLRYWLGLKLANVPVPHRAPGDCYVTAAILRRILSMEVTLQELLEVSSRPAMLPYFTFGKHAMTPVEKLPGDYLHWVLDNIKDNPDVAYTAFTELKRRRSA